MRYDHYITRSQAAKKPSCILCVDCESQNDTLTKWNCVPVYSVGQDSLIGSITCKDTIDDWWTYLQDLSAVHSSLWVLSARCGITWHLLNFWQEIECCNVCLTQASNNTALHRHLRNFNAASGYLVIQDPPNIARFRMCDLNRWITWVDLRNYGVDLPCNILDSKSVCQWLATWQRSALQLLSGLSLGGWRATVGNIALNGWRRSYLTASVYAHCHATGQALEEAAYFGGRCEAYRLGEFDKPVHILDVRSMYPAMCAECSVPTRLRHVSTNDMTIHRWLSENPLECIAEVTIDTQEPAYPYRTVLGSEAVASDYMGNQIKVRTGTHKEVVYPVGRFTTTLCGPELKDALENNNVYDVHRCGRYYMADVLRGYAVSLYEARTSNAYNRADGTEQFIKSLLVSIVGKLAQKEHFWIDCPDHYTDLLYGAWYGKDEHGNTCRYRSIAGIVQRDFTGGFAQNSIPAIAGYICSAARIRLLAYIRRAGWSEVIYCDTDSIITTETGYRRLRESGMVRTNELGHIRLVSSHEGAEIYGIKHYRAGTTYRAAGIPMWVRNRDSEDSQMQAPRRMVDYLYSSQRPKACSGGIKRDSAGPYRHRIINVDGSTRAYRVNNGKLE